jgi:uncharacterized protein (TIGR03083 family)
MDTAAYLSHLSSESQLLIDAVAAAPDAAVSHCDWTMFGLAVHTGSVWNTAAVNVAAATGERTELTLAANAPDGDPVPWLEAIRTDLLDVLGNADPASPAWSFTPRRDAGFWQRRMLHETAVHRWDAQYAAGTLEPLPIDVARDGIDEYLEVGLQHSSRRPDRGYPPQSLHLHCTDTEGEWMLVGGSEGLAITHEHGKGDSAVRGTAEHILLWIWGRPEVDVQIFGDEAVAEAWQQLAP